MLSPMELSYQREDIKIQICLVILAVKLTIQELYLNIPKLIFL